MNLVCVRKSLRLLGWSNLQYIPKIPKNPVKDLATNNQRTPLNPSGKSGTLALHIHTVQNIVVSPCLANKIWKGCIPSPSSSNNRVATFINAPNNWAKVTKNNPWLSCQKFLKESFHVLASDKE